ncbi:MAG: hypothetical protein QF879_21310 [Candidatus Latescibacteria bacterium]|nr:hypothetical protein [Candidatus Latescibacterota bacterium]
MYIDIIKNYPHPLIGGWHIEEAIYAAMYGHDPDHSYYPNYHYAFQRHYEVQVLEARLPDVVLFHLTTDDETIRERMQTASHEYQIIKSQDIPELKQRFEDELDQSLLKKGGRLVTLDTTGKTPEESLDELLLKSEPLVTDGEMAMRAVAIPEADFEIRYENGVRKMISG